MLVSKGECCSRKQNHLLHTSLILLFQLFLLLVLELEQVVLLPKLVIEQ